MHSERQSPFHRHAAQTGNIQTGAQGCSCMIEYPIVVGRAYLYQDRLLHNCCGRTNPQTNRERVTVTEKLGAVYAYTDRYGSVGYAAGSELTPVKSQ